ncbi:hypothetical protein PENTCL1PPCAC_18668, partial [Pristionchus entomophagus]
CEGSCPESAADFLSIDAMPNDEILGFHITGVSIILVALTFIVSTLIAGATAFVDLSIAALLAVITIATVEIITCGIHIIAIRESCSRLILPNLVMSAFNIILSVLLCVMSVIDLTSGNQAMSTQVLMTISPASFADAESDPDGGDSKPNNSTPILVISILLSTVYVISFIYNAFVLHVHLKCYRYLVAAEKQITEWSDTESAASLFPELTYEKKGDWDDWAKKPRSITSIKEEDEDDFYYRYLAE